MLRTSGGSGGSGDRICQCKFSFTIVDNNKKSCIIEVETAAGLSVAALKQVAGSVSVHLRSFGLGFDSFHGLT